MPVLDGDYFLNLRDNLDKLGIKNYTVRPDGTVDVARSVYLSCIHLNEIPVQFGTVSGDFYCSKNQLTSLAGCPETVQGDFSCGGNQLTSLAGCPKKVQGRFWCYNNQKQFTESEVRAACKVKGKIHV